MMFVTVQGGLNTNSFFFFFATLFYYAVQGSFLTFEPVDLIQSEAII